MQKSHIYLVDDLISEKDCKILIDFIQRGAREETEMNPDTNVKANFCKLNPEMNLFVKPIINNIVRVLTKIGFEIYDCTVPILRQIYGPTYCHTDNVYDDEREKNVPINRLRCMSLVIALNDDYEGGEFCFPEQNYTVKLKRGQAVLFPPFWTHPHYTNKLYNDTFRYTITSWFYGSRIHPTLKSVHGLKDLKPGTLKQ